MAGQRVRKPFRSDTVDLDKFNEIIERMMNGETITKLCSKLEFPDYHVFVNWVAYDPDLYTKYARAKQVQADYFAEQIIDISDDETNPQRARNRMDSRRWHASKIAPRKYGDRVLNELTGNVTTTQKVDLSNLSPEVRQKLREAIQSQMNADPKQIETSYKVVK